MQTVIIFEGVDNTGKTAIAKSLSKLIGIPYFKNPREKEIVKSGDTAVETRHGVMLMDFLNLTGHSVIFDRNYPSEWAYGLSIRGKCDREGIKMFDAVYSSMGSIIVYCHKDNPPVDDWLSADKVKDVVDHYEMFLGWTDCKVIDLDTSDEDVFRQLRFIESSLQKLGHIDDAGRLGRALNQAGVGDAGSFAQN